MTKVFAILLFSITHLCYGKEVLFRNAHMSAEKYQNIIQSKNAMTPAEFYLNALNHKELNYELLDACLKKTESRPNCTSEILGFLETTLNTEERENLKAVLQDLLTIKKFKNSFIYSNSLLNSLESKKRKSPLPSLRVRGAISFLEKTNSLSDLKILRNGMMISREELLWFDDNFSQWTLIYSTRPPVVFTGYLKQVLDVLEKDLEPKKRTCEDLKELFANPILPPQFEVVGLSNCEIKRDLFMSPGALANNPIISSISHGNKKLLYFAGGFIATVVLLDYLRDKKVVFSSSF